jgi:Icc protein
MLIAQITDFHIRVPGKLAYRRVDTAACLSRCVAQLMRLDPLPDIVLATGDLVDSGQLAEYRHVRELLAPLTMPVYLIPGNHDERSALRNEFSDHAYLPRDAAFLQYAVDAGPLRLIALDTVVPRQDGGTLCEERLAWLADRLDEARNKPAVIFMHHPPFATGIGFMDEAGLDDVNGLARIVARHPQIERILCGHLHRSIQARFHGALASTCPSTAHQVALDLRRDAPSTFVMEPPGYQLHYWNGGGLVTHTAAIGNFEGPYSFSE